MNVFRARITVPHSHHVKTEDGLGWRTVDLPDTWEEIELRVDVETLCALLGRRACLSKGGEARGCSGLVVAKHRKK